MKHRLLSMLGLARRARRLSLGFDAAREAARSGQAADSICGRPGIWQEKARSSLLAFLARRRHSGFRHR